MQIHRAQEHERRIASQPSLSVQKPFQLEINSTRLRYRAVKKAWQRAVQSHSGRSAARANERATTLSLSRLCVGRSAECSKLRDSSRGLCSDHRKRASLGRDWCRLFGRLQASCSALASSFMLQTAPHPYTGAPFLLHWGSTAPV